MPFARYKTPKLAAVFTLHGCLLLSLLSSPAAAFDEIMKLFASDGVENDQFGHSVAISGASVIVGAPWDNVVAARSGSAYLFHQENEASWTQTKLTPDDGAGLDEFGISVAVSGNTAIVGAHLDNQVAARGGSVYLFRNSGSGWNQIDKIWASDGGISQEFGISVAMDGNLAVVGAKGARGGTVNSAGAAYVFVDDGAGNWSQLAKLHAGADAAASDNFGISVAIDGNLVLVGADLNDDGGNNSGSAYLFEVHGQDDWEQVAKFTADDDAAGDLFGHSVALDGDLAIIGAHNDDNIRGSSAGSAYVFHDDGDEWTQYAHLVGSDGLDEDRFGTSVGISGNTVIVGAYAKDKNGSGAGSAYLFEILGENDWDEIDQLFASDASSSDQLGWSVALDGDAAVAGAILANGSASQTGAAYVFQQPSSLLVGDYNGDGKVTAADFTVWCDNLGASELTNRDPDNSGPVGTDDYYSWMDNYGQPFAAAAFQAVAIPEPIAMQLIIFSLAPLWLARIRVNLAPTTLILP